MQMLAPMRTSDICLCLGGCAMLFASILLYLLRIFLLPAPWDIIGLTLVFVGSAIVLAVIIRDMLYTNRMLLVAMAPDARHTNQQHIQRNSQP